MRSEVGKLAKKKKKKYSLCKCGQVSGSVGCQTGVVFTCSMVKAMTLMLRFEGMTFDGYLLYVHPT